MNTKNEKITATIKNLETYDLNLDLRKKPEMVGEMSGIKIYHRPIPGSFIACITISPETNQPIIFVDDIFFSLTPKCMKFVLLHEIGHYVLGHFIPTTGKEAKYQAKKELIDKLRKEYPRKEQDADYYAMYKMDSVEDAKNALIEIENRIETVVSSSLRSLVPLDKMKKLHNRRLDALVRNSVQGAYYINEGPNPNNDIKLELSNNNDDEENNIIGDIKDIKIKEIETFENLEMLFDEDIPEEILKEMFDSEEELSTITMEKEEELVKNFDMTDFDFVPLHLREGIEFDN